MQFQIGLRLYVNISMICLSVLFVLVCFMTLQRMFQVLGVMYVSNLVIPHVYLIGLKRRMHPHAHYVVQVSNIDVSLLTLSIVSYISYHIHP